MPRPSESTMLVTKQDEGKVRMLAAYYEGDHRIVVRDVDRKPPGHGEVQLQVAFTGICGTDLHIHDGDMDARVTRPAILGHEMSGTVVEVGDGVTEWSPGDSVVVVPLDWCGTCPACVSGNSHICHRLNFIGIDSPGALQNYWNVHKGCWSGYRPGSRCERLPWPNRRRWPCMMSVGPSCGEGRRL